MDADFPTPIFLFSLPRSGSTLMQRILAVDPAISTAAEPHLLLPHIYSMRERGMYAEYGQMQAVRAIEDFCALLPHGREDYLREIASFAVRIYAKASIPGRKYFFDKTPRYHLIADEICRTFENGRFIFLWRNPLAIAASIMDTWGGGRWNLYRSKIDLFEGLQNLVEVFKKYQERACALKYENLVADPETSFRKVFEYLDLPFNPNALSGFKKLTFEGRYGDPTQGRYQSISSEPLVKWRNTLAGPFRKAWCRRYLNWIGSDRLAVMGYDMDELVYELNSIPSRYKNLPSDLARAGFGAAFCALEPRIIKHKMATLRSWHRVHAHL